MSLISNNLKQDTDIDNFMKKFKYPSIAPLRISTACSNNVSNILFGTISYILYTSFTLVASLLHVGRFVFVMYSLGNSVDKSTLSISISRKK